MPSSFTSRPWSWLVVQTTGASSTRGPGGQTDGADGADAKFTRFSAAAATVTYGMSQNGERNDK